jgi:hypothetical protein
MPLGLGIRIIEVCQMGQTMFLIHVSAAALALWGGIHRRVNVGAQNMSPNTGCSAFRVMSNAPCNLRYLEFASVVMLRASVALTNPLLLANPISIIVTLPGGTPHSNSPPTINSAFCW